MCHLVHEPGVSLLDLIVKDFKITWTSGVAHTHDPEPLVTEMNVDLFKSFKVGHDVVVEGVSCGGVDECGVVEVALVGVFGDDVDVEDKKEILEDARVGTRSELADHYDKRKQMRNDGKYDAAAEEEWERVRRELKRGAHKSLKEHNKAKLMVLNTPVGDILLI